MASFVYDLEISADPRLNRFAPQKEVALETVRGSKEPQDFGSQPEAIGETLRAAVNAGSIISFVSGLTAEEKSDVLYSTQLAQRAASAKFNRFAATDQWYGVYREVLERLGWVGENFAFTDRGSATGEIKMDRSALDVISTIATGNQLAILVKTLDTLKKLGEDAAPLTIFDLQSMAELSGNFQLGSVQRAENAALSLALGAFHFKSTDERRKFLFWSWGAASIHFWTAASKMTLNSELYAQHRSAVAAKLAADAGSYIAALEIA